MFYQKYHSVVVFYVFSIDIFLKSIWIFISVMEIFHNISHIVTSQFFVLLYNKRFSMSYLYSNFSVFIFFHSFLKTFLSISTISPKLHLSRTPIISWLINVIINFCANLHLSATFFIGNLSFLWKNLSAHDLRCLISWFSFYFPRSSFLVLLLFLINPFSFKTRFLCSFTQSCKFKYHV